MAYAPTNAAAATDGRQQNVERVRTALDTYLRHNPEFHSWPDEKKVSFYRHALQSGVQALELGMVQELATGQIGPPTGLRDVAGLAGAFLDEVSFPEFVKSLITGTYGSIVGSTIEQMNAYVEMYKGLAAPLGAIVRTISDADAVGQIASNDPSTYRLEGATTLVENETGTRIEVGGDQEVPDNVQQLLFQAKMELARERRLILRETMLMGVQRLVVDKGVIKAGLLFNVRGTEKSQQREKETEIEESGGQFGGSFLGFFGGGKSDKETRISVSTRQLDTDIQLAAQITGHVEVQFSTDRFNLNNFATLFGNEATQRELQQRQGTQPGTPGAPAPTVTPVPAPAPVPAR